MQYLRFIIFQNNRYAIILEFKVYNSNKEKDLQDTVKQYYSRLRIKNMLFLLEVKGIQTERIQKYGFAFKGKEVLISLNLFEYKNEKRYKKSVSIDLLFAPISQSC